MKYLFYDESGRVRLIHYNRPAHDVIEYYSGMVEYNGIIDKVGYNSDITVDLETKEVTVSFIKSSNNDEEIIELKEQLSVISDTLDFVLSGGEV